MFESHNYGDRIMTRQRSFGACIMQLTKYLAYDHVNFGGWLFCMLRSISYEICSVNNGGQASDWAEAQSRQATRLRRRVTKRKAQTS